MCRFANGFAIEGKMSQWYVFPTSEKDRSRSVDASYSAPAKHVFAREFLSRAPKMPTQFGAKQPNRYVRDGFRHQSPFIRTEAHLNGSWGNLILPSDSAWIKLISCARSAI